MSESIYKQVLNIASPQIKALANSIEFYLVQEQDLTPREFDWDDISQHNPGVSVRYVLDGMTRATTMAPTNSHNPVGFPLYIVMVSPKGVTWDAELEAIESLKQKLRQYYHQRRRMELVSSPGVLTNVSTVSEGGPQPPSDFVARHKVQMLTIMFWFEEPQTE